MQGLGMEIPFVRFQIQQHEDEQIEHGNRSSIHNDLGDARSHEVFGFCRCVLIAFAVRSRKKTKDLPD